MLIESFVFQFYLYKFCYITCHYLCVLYFAILCMILFICYACIVFSINICSTVVLICRIKRLFLEDSLLITEDLLTHKTEQYVLQVQASDERNTESLTITVNINGEYLETILSGSSVLLSSPHLFLSCGCLGLNRPTYPVCPCLSLLRIVYSYVNGINSPYCITSSMTPLRHFMSSDVQVYD